MQHFYFCSHFSWTKFQRNTPIVYVEKVLDVLFQLVKNESEIKSVAFIFLFSVQ